MQAAVNETERTASDASLSATSATVGEQLQLVTFELGEEEFAIDILAVREINRMMQITRVPQSPADVEGVINLRGRIIPVVNLRQRFGMQPDHQSNESRIVVVDVNGHTIGFVVDRVHEVLRIDGSIVEAAPAMASSIDSDYIRGVGKLEDRLLILIDLDRLFNRQQLSDISEVAENAAAE